MLFKDVSRRDYFSCATIECMSNPSTNEKYILAGYGNGKIVSYTVSKDVCAPVSKLNIGSSVSNNYLLEKYFSLFILHSNNISLV